MSLVAGLVLLVKGFGWSTPLLLTASSFAVVETRKPLRKVLLTFFAGRERAPISLVEPLISSHHAHRPILRVARRPGVPAR